MGRLKDIVSLLSAIPPVITVLGVIGSVVLVGYTGRKAKEKRNAERFNQAQVLEGKVIKEGYYSATGGGCDAVKPAAYHMIVEMPDGSKRTFTYSGNEAQIRDTEYDAGDEVRFRDSFRPGDSF